MVDHSAVSKENMEKYIFNISISIYLLNLIYFFPCLSFFFFFFRMAIAYKIHSDREAKKKGKKRGREEELNVKEEPGEGGGVDPPLLLSLFMISNVSVLSSLSYYVPSWSSWGVCGRRGGNEVEEEKKDQAEGKGKEKEEE